MMVESSVKQTGPESMGVKFSWDLVNTIYWHVVKMCFVMRFLIYRLKDRRQASYLNSWLRSISNSGSGSQACAQFYSEDL